MENEVNKIGNPYLIKEKRTGLWKVCFKYTNNKGKQAKYYYSDGLNDITFLH
ncbi:hypothetical protein L950_0210710 [Sphingobacterium sp. IITKGP-BTPF85]|nr:hypothetical protein L950_0210710 [Sphingobacterium sp. IITKGP-BTPF85]